MPPRQGQSQFISPVSSLNAPSDAASDSVAEGSERGDGVDSSVKGERGLDEGVEDSEVAVRFRDLATESRVGRDVSSVREVGVRGSSTRYRKSLLVGRCWKTHALAHRRSRDWCCSNRWRPRPGPI